jgi:uncharacterized protein YbcI
VKTEEVERGISDELARIHIESYGEEPESISVQIWDDNVVCVIDVKLLAHERLLAEHDHADQVKETRGAYEDAMGPTFKAAVERMTGRRVIAFLSNTSLDPPFAIEYFRLAPQ